MEFRVLEFDPINGAFLGADRQLGLPWIDHHLTSASKVRSESFQPSLIRLDMVELSGFLAGTPRALQLRGNPDVQNHNKRLLTSLSPAICIIVTTVNKATTLASHAARQEGNNTRNPKARLARSGQLRSQTDHLTAESLQGYILCSQRSGAVSSRRALRAGSACTKSA